MASHFCSSRYVNSMSFTSQPPQVYRTGPDTDDDPQGFSTMVRCRTHLVETLYRTDWGRIVATLINVLRDFDLAEDVAQEAFAAAVAQ